MCDVYSGMDYWIGILEWTPFDLTKLPLVSLSGCGMVFCRVPTAYTDIMGAVLTKKKRNKSCRKIFPPAG